MALASRMSVSKPRAPSSRSGVAIRLAPAGVVGGSSLLLVGTSFPAPAFAASSGAAAKFADIVSGTGGLVSSLSEKAAPLTSSAIEQASKALEEASPVVKSSLDAVAPVVSDAATKIVAAAKPAGEAAIKALADQGVDTATVTDVASKTVTVAGPAVEKTVGVLQGVVAALSEQEPQDLAVYAGAAVVLYLAAPSLLGALSVAARGYAGEYTALQALDVLVTESNAVLVDIRGDSEVAGSGLPDVPRAASGKVNRVPSGIESGALRGQFKDVNSVEDGVAAMRVAGLKRVTRGTQILLLDSNGSKASNIAKRLSSMGFGQVYVIKGGFNGWKKSQLPTKAAMQARGVEVLPPGGATGLLQLPGGR